MIRSTVAFILKVISTIFSGIVQTSANGEHVARNRQPLGRQVD